MTKRRKKKEIPDFWKEPIAGFDPWHGVGKEYYFDVEVAENVIDFIETHCKHSKGQFYGQPFKLEKWEKQYFGHLFGWKRKKSGKRRFRNTFLFIPRKNGKTQIAAALLLILVKYDGELGADVYCCAACKEQASIVYDAAKSMVLMDDELGEGIKIWKSTRSMEYTDEAGRPAGMCKVLASDGDLMLGMNPHAFVIDEVLAQKKFDIMENLESGVGTRQQPLGIYLSTAADDGYNPCNLKIDYARQVRDGVVDDMTFFPVIYELAQDADWHDEENWKKVNPNLGVTITLDFLRSEYVKALRNKADEIKFKRRYLNMSIASIDSWLSMEKWNNCRHDVKMEDLLGQRCYATLDLSSTTDISALMFYFPDLAACFGLYYCPETAFKNKIEYGVMFKDELRIIPGSVINYEIIRADLKAMQKIYKIEKVGFDPWNAKEFSNILEKDGFEMVQIGQSAKDLTDPIRQLESQIISGNLCHFGSKVLKWMAGNCFLWTDTNGKAAKVIKKNKDSPGKIDGMIALIMAKALEISENINDDGDSIFESDPEEFKKTLKEIYG